MNKYLFHSVKIATETLLIKKGSLTIVDSKITNISELNKQIDDPNFLKLDCTNYLITPGFIDMHTHGGYGYALETATDEIEFIKFTKQLAAEGVTRFCQATVTSSFKNLQIYAEKYKIWKKSQTAKIEGAQTIGIYLEGPYISETFKGAHETSLLVKPELDQLEILLELFENDLKIVAFAPEIDSDHILVDFCRQHKIRASAAHSAISFDEFAKNVYPNNVFQVTHLFNGMSKFDHHNPGLAVAALYYEPILCELICDGFHVHRDLIKFIFKVKKSRRIALITDATSMKGLPSGNYHLGTVPVTSNQEKVFLTDQTSTLAGSTLRFDIAYSNFQKFTGANEVEMSHVSATNAAHALDLSTKTGSLAIEKLADLVILNEQKEVMLTMVAGRVIFCAPEFRHYNIIMKR